MTDEIRMAVELRADESMSSPGRLTGTLMKYGERAADRAEIFEPGSLSWPSNGVLLRRQHSREAPIARVIPETRGNEVVLDHPLPDSSAGRDAALEVRNGTLPALSVEFRATAQRYVAGVRRISSALLTGAGLVDDPSYPGSHVEVRNREGAVRQGTGKRLWL